MGGCFMKVWAVDVKLKSQLEWPNVAQAALLFKSVLYVQALCECLAHRTWMRFW